AEDGIRDKLVTGVQTCALPIWFMGRRYDEVTEEIKMVPYKVEREGDHVAVVVTHEQASAGPLKKGDTFGGNIPSGARYTPPQIRSEERRVGKELVHVEVADG